MDKNNRPVGRQKRVGSGTGNVQKRGGGLGGGPVGSPNSYNGRRNSSNSTGSSSGGSNSGSSFFGNLGSNSGNRKKPGCLTYIIILLVIGYLGYQLYNNLFGDPQPTNNNIQSSTNSGLGTASNSSTYDSGAYPVVTSVSNKARAKRTQLKGNGN